MQLNSWFLAQPATHRRLRLYCYSYAGGSATEFIKWQAALPLEVELCPIQLPGRGMRFNEKPYVSLTTLVADIVKAIAEKQTDDLPFAFFGHSLGALVSFEVARSLRHQNLKQPLQLIVSGSNPPGVKREQKRLHDLPEEELIEALKEYNGTPPEVLAHREFMKLVLPTIRADFALVENYTHIEQSPLDVPISVFAGKNDPHIFPDKVENWKAETSQAFRLHWFEGDHFFIHSEQAQVLDRLTEECVALLDKIGMGAIAQPAVA